MSLDHRQIIAQMSMRTGMTLIECESAVNALTAVVSQALSLDETVNMRGFGKFKVIEKIKGEHSIRFQPCTALTEAVQQSHYDFSINNDIDDFEDNGTMDLT